MENLKKILTFVLGMAMVLGVAPAFAAQDGTNTATVTLGDVVSIVVTGAADFTDISAK
ncbi:hypothetical protein [Methanobacterium sp. SMA-27]|uniref:hypothetical protein n=1 Tax=Methanobacterium sp. SMA-27 TaxID=1495336 RepID=UPI000B262522|nr:hypothetical protein [Methanobacterium sp. SMA-27]